MANTTYATLTDLKTHAGMPATGEDTLLQALLNAAASMVDGYCNTTFVSTTATLELHDGDGGRFLQLRHRPVISVATVELDGSAISSDEYEIDNAQGWLVIPEYDAETVNPRIWRGGEGTGCWPRGTRNIGITYAYGYATVPDAVSVATCMVAAALYQSGQRRGVSAKQLGPLSYTFTSDQHFPSAARAALERYREFEVAG